MDKESGKERTERIKDTEQLDERKSDATSDETLSDVFILLPSSFFWAPLFLSSRASKTTPAFPAPRRS